MSHLAEDQQVYQNFEKFGGLPTSSGYGASGTGDIKFTTTGAGAAGDAAESERPTDAPGIAILAACTFSCTLLRTGCGLADRARGVLDINVTVNLAHLDIGRRGQFTVEHEHRQLARDRTPHSSGARRRRENIAGARRTERAQ